MMRTINKIINNSPMKEILASYRVRFKTLKGFATWIFFTVIWYGLLISYLSPVKDYVVDYLLSVGINGIVSKILLTPLLVSLFFTPISLTLTFFIIFVYNLIKGMFK